MKSENKPFNINNVHHVAFRCRDAEQTRWFYEDVLGLKLAAALAFDHLSGTKKEMEYMHIFFEMKDGNYIAFFDDPHNAPSDFFKDMNGFDSHVAVEVSSMSEIENIKTRLSEVGWDSFLINHEFVHSLYIFDPNGIQLEFTCRDEKHDQIMEDDAKKAHKAINEWTKRTRDLKVSTFGPKALDQREK